MSYVIESVFYAIVHNILFNVFWKKKKESGLISRQTFAVKNLIVSVLTSAVYVQKADEV